MTAPAVPAAVPGVAEARELTKALRRSLKTSLALLTEVYDARVWDTQGYPSWSAYCAAELPELAVIGKGLPEQQRTEVVVALAGRGLSTRGIAEPLGLGASTVSRVLRAAGTTRTASTGTDGRTRRVTATTARRRTARPRGDVTARVLAAVAAAGPDGATVLAVMQAARLPRESVSPALFRLADTGRLAYLRPERRGQFGRYVDPALVR